MPQTPLTVVATNNGSGYATVAQLLPFIDLRILGQLASDDGTKITPANLATNTTLLILIQAASGQLDSAVAIGQRYTPADIQALVVPVPGRPDLTSNAQMFVFKIIAGLLIGEAYSRRIDKTEPPPQNVWAEDMLERLRNGAAIFPTNEAVAASLPTDFGDQEQDVLNRGGAGITARRFFGSRTNFGPNRIS